MQKSASNKNKVVKQVEQELTENYDKNNKKEVNISNQTRTNNFSNNTCLLKINR